MPVDIEKSGDLVECYQSLSDTLTHSLTDSRIKSYLACLKRFQLFHQVMGRYNSVAAFAELTERETEGVINFRVGSLLKGSQHNIPAIVYF